MMRAGAGQATAVIAFMAATPEFEHHFLVSPDPTCPVEGSLDQASSVTQFPPKWRDRARILRKAIRQLQPSVIHAHSSLGGALTRLTLPRGWREQVVYTPHCYAFLRRDVTPLTRAFFWCAEALMTLRTGRVAACSALEARAAEALPGNRPVFLAPNVVTEKPRRCSSASRTAAQPIVIVTSGRVTAAKAPELFAEAARRSNARSTSAKRWVWVGGGNPHDEEGLRDAGVDVTGWVNRESALRLIESADVYVHTAAWEAAPMTILEAAAADVPVLARDIAPLKDLGLRPRWRDVDELLELLDQFPDGPAFRVALEALADVRQRHSLPRLRAGLMAAYGATPTGRAG